MPTTKQTRARKPFKKRTAPAVALNRLVRRLSEGDCNRIAQALGLALGYYHSPGDDSRGLAFTVCGGKLVNGEDAPDWLANMNGDCVDEIAREALRRGAVKRTGRWTWERCLPNTKLSEPTASL